MCACRFTFAAQTFRQLTCKSREGITKLKTKSFSLRLGERKGVVVETRGASGEGLGGEPS